MNLNSKNPQRQHDYRLGLSELSQIELPSVNGRNGELIASDEAEVWKRVLSYRIARFLSADHVFEMHPGQGVGTAVYRAASPKAAFFSDDTKRKEFDIIDIDPFGWPWESLDTLRENQYSARVVFVSSGEIQAVVRRLRRAKKYKTNYYGKDTPKWVENECVPRIEDRLKKKCQFFFAYPTIFRGVFSDEKLPEKLFEGCPKWMWWLKNYV